MVKKLQRKFINVTMIALVLVLLLVIGITNGIYIYEISEKQESLLRMLSDNNGEFPDREFEEERLSEKGPDRKKPEEQREGLLGFVMSEETPFETRYFSVTVSESGSMQADMENVAAVSEEDAVDFASSIMEKEKERGYIGRYRYRVKQTGDEKLIVFVDCRNDYESIRNFVLTSLLAAIGCFGVFFILVVLLSRRVLRPIIDSIEKQRQFITDAGHEIKTPLAIISANTEVIEMYEGENEWTQSIHNQVNRLNELVKNLLMLAKLEERGTNLKIEDCDVSAVTKDIFSEFEALVKQKQLCIEEHAEKSVMVQADPYALYNLISIFVDNAVKYTPDGGRIHVEIRKGEHQAELTLYNDCANLPEGDLNRLFDRFYRADESRSRESGGYGIGLSIAYQLVKVHKWKMSVKRAENGIVFHIFIHSER